MGASRFSPVVRTGPSTGNRDVLSWRATPSSPSPPESSHLIAGRVVATVTIVVLGCVGASDGDQSRIGVWGLIQALPALYFVSVALLTLSFFLELAGRRRSNSLVLGVHVVGMVVLLHGAPGFLESEPRFATAWLHAGFTDQILDRGVSAPSTDARFDWPGFFGAAAAVAGAGGLKSSLPLLRWAPVFMVLLYLPPLFAIGRHLTRSDTVAWLALWLFLLVNWVGQDYYAPQAVGFVLYLASIAILVGFFRDGRHLPLGARISRWRDELPRDGLPDLVASPRLRIALVVLLTLVAAAVAVSHQLSPIALVIGSTFLVLTGRCRLLVYPVVAGILTLGWISVGATPYWVGHLGTIFGGLGDFRAVFSNSVGERIGGSATHHTLVNLRLAYTIVVWTLMTVSILALGARHRPPVTLAGLAVAPFVMAVQNYGTEGVLRIFLFSSPFATLIIAQAAVGAVRHRLGRVLVPALCLALVPLFVLTRYGNESYEQVRPDEVQALRTLYAIAPPGSVVISPTTQLPWRFAHATDYRYTRPLDREGFRRGDPEAIRVLSDSGSHGAAATYLVVTTSQIVYATEALGAPRGWFDKVRPLLSPANGYRLVYRNADAVIYEYEGPR